jgi:hypothetical protein
MLTIRSATMMRLRYGCLSGWAVALLVAVATGAETPAKPNATTTPDVAATIGGEVITLHDVDERALKTNMKLAQSLYNARRAVLDQIILERAFAAEAGEAGTTVDLLIRKKIAEKTTPITSADIEAFYNANKARMRGRTIEKATPQIRTRLMSQRQVAAKRGLLAEAKKTTSVEIKLGPPRAEVLVAANEPSKGPAGAKVTIVEFSDFQ